MKSVSTTKLRRVPFSEMLVRINQPIVVKDDQMYNMVGVRWYGKGAFIRESRIGMDISRKQQWVIKSGNITYNKLFAWKGAFAVAGRDVDGCIVSDKFPLYEHNSNFIDLRYLQYYFQTQFVAEDARRLSKGAAAISKLTLNPPDFLRLEIPLPPTIEEQRQIADRIDRLVSKVEETQILRDLTIRENDSLPSMLFDQIISKGQKLGWKQIPFREACEINPSRRGTSCNSTLNVSFVPMAAVDAAAGTISRPRIRPYQEVNKGYTWFTEGDVIFAKITPCMENGKAAIARNLCNGVGFGSTEFHVLRPRRGVLAEWIHRYVRQNRFRAAAKMSFRATAGHKRVPEEFFDSQTIAVPEEKEQLRIINYLDNFQSKIDNLKKFQKESQINVNALIPSILAGTFRED